MSSFHLCAVSIFTQKPMFTKELRGLSAKPCLSSHVVCSQMFSGYFFVHFLYSRSYSVLQCHFAMAFLGTSLVLHIPSHFSLICFSLRLSPWLRISDSCWQYDKWYLLSKLGGLGVFVALEELLFLCPIVLSNFWETGFSFPNIV